MTTEVLNDSLIDGLGLDELTHVLLDGHWISPFYFDGEFSVDSRGQVTEIHQHVDEGPGNPRHWQRVKASSVLFLSLKEAIEREHKEVIADALRDRAYERSVERRQSWW